MCVLIQKDEVLVHGGGDVFVDGTLTMQLFLTREKNTIDFDKKNRNLHLGIESRTKSVLIESEIISILNCIGFPNVTAFPRDPPKNDGNNVF